MIEIDFILRVAGREALQAGSNGEDPWEWSPTLLTVPEHDSWVWIRAPGKVESPVRARAGYAEHGPGSDELSKYEYCPKVTTTLHLDSLSEEQAADIGVEWHPWMDDTVEPKPLDAKKSAERGALVDAFEKRRLGKP